MIQQYQTIGEIFFTLRAKFRWKNPVYCCVVQCMGRNTHDVSGDSEAMLSFFGSKFSVRVYIWRTGQTFAINWSKIQLSWVLTLYYPYKTTFSAYKSVIVTPCACDLFVSKVTKITRYMDVRLWRSFFGAFFSVWWLYLEINHSLVAEIICTIYLFIHARTQHFKLKKFSTMFYFQLIIMCIYHALINALCAHMIHINLNMIFYTHVEHSPTKTIYIKYYWKQKQKTTTTKRTTNTHTHARARTHWL